MCWSCNDDEKMKLDGNNYSVVIIIIRTIICNNNIIQFPFPIAHTIPLTNYSIILLPISPTYTTSLDSFSAHSVLWPCGNIPHFLVTEWRMLSCPSGAGTMEFHPTTPEPRKKEEQRGGPRNPGTLQNTGERKSVKPVTNTQRTSRWHPAAPFCTSSCVCGTE
jgi:hypothetical protein